MSRTPTHQRQQLKAWAIELAGLGTTQERIGRIIEVPQSTVSRMLTGEEIVHTPCYIMHKNGGIMHNSGVIMHNFSQGHPSHPVPRLLCAKAESLPFREPCVDLIITSPPYNLSNEKWDMGGNTSMSGRGRGVRPAGIGYEDAMPEDQYQAWQRAVLRECYRVATPGASMFYNHKVRQVKNRTISPTKWLEHPENPWTVHQEIIWDRRNTHNHAAALFWPIDERIYWLTKGRPTLPDHSIGMPTVWSFHGPVAYTWHPAPFPPELPKRCLQALGRPGITVFDPFGGSMTTCLVAYQLGYKSIGVDSNVAYIHTAREHQGWTSTT